MEKESECWLPDGRKAVYAGEIDGQKFVRIIRSTDDEYGYEEWLDERLIAVGQVYASEPQEVYGQQTKAAQDRITSLRTEADAIRDELSKLKDRKQEVEQAAKLYPDISRVIDFIEGHITHAVELCSRTGPKVMTIDEALVNIDEGKREPSMKLLALFGNQKSIHWGINRYNDGSGSWTKIVPANGLDEVRQIITDAATKAIEEFRSGKEKQIHIVARFGQGEYAVTLPEDIQKAISDKAEAAKTARIAKAEKELAKARAA